VHVGGQWAQHGIHTRDAAQPCVRVTPRVRPINTWISGMNAAVLNTALTAEGLPRSGTLLPPEASARHDGEQADTASATLPRCDGHVAVVRATNDAYDHSPTLRSCETQKSRSTHIRSTFLCLQTPSAARPPACLPYLGLSHKSGIYEGWMSSRAQQPFNGNVLQQSIVVNGQIDECGRRFFDQKLAYLPLLCDSHCVETQLSTGTLH
jgi:hypothetical protein